MQLCNASRVASKNACQGKGGRHDADEQRDGAALYDSGRPIMYSRLPDGSRLIRLGGVGVRWGNGYGTSYDLTCGLKIAMFAGCSSVEIENITSLQKGVEGRYSVPGELRRSLILKFGERVGGPRVYLIINLIITHLN